MGKDIGILDNDIDMEMMLEGMKYARRVADTEPYRKILVREVSPGPEVDSDEKMKEAIRATVQTLFHPIGTASMLPKEDGGVVDSKLKVYGTENIRVVSDPRSGQTQFESDVFC